MAQKMFVAGASGVIGLPLCKMLLAAGHEVYGTTRSSAKAQMLMAHGIKPIILLMRLTPMACLKN